jgi:hypothetical protein
MPSNINPSDVLYKWDISAGTVTAIGSTGFTQSGNETGEMAMQGGKIYRIFKNVIPQMYSIVEIDTLVPSDSHIVVFLSIK